MKKVLFLLCVLLLIFALKAQDTSDENNGQDEEEEQDTLEARSENYESENITNETDSQPANMSLPESVRLEMGSREMRYHHYLWHQVREGWNRFTPEAQARYTEIGWAPPNPARNYDEDGRSSAVLDNLSGEDFLYMHRQMIKRVNEIITLNNDSYGNVTGWKKIPAPGDEFWPVPDLYNVTNNSVSTESSNIRKTDDYFERIQEAEKNFTDPEQLKNMSLAELGARIEVTIHGWLHLRFSSNCSYGYRNSYRNRTHLPYIDPKWDDLQYDWLGDSYSSHVHAAFYKVHGWVDDRIEDWRIANNLTEIIWNGTWEGGPVTNITNLLETKQSFTTVHSAHMSHSSMSHSSFGNMNVLEDVLDIFLKSGAPETTFADEVMINGEIPWAPKPQLKTVSEPMQIKKTRRLCQYHRPQK